MEGKQVASVPSSVVAGGECIGRTEVEEDMLELGLI